MEMPQKIDDYIKHSIDYLLRIPVPVHALQSMLNASEEASNRLRDQFTELQFKLREKDDAIYQARAEAIMDAQPLRKLVEENEVLAAERADLLSQCSMWENECCRLERDREMLMEIVNRADERAVEAEMHVHELGCELERVVEELRYYNISCEVDSSLDKPLPDEDLLGSLLESATCDEEFEALAHTFLEANADDKVLLRFLQTWNRLKPLTRKVLYLVARIQVVEIDKENIVSNLRKAEEEVQFLSEENCILDLENQRLLKQLSKEGSIFKSCGNNKVHKKKASPSGESIKNTIDGSDSDSDLVSDQALSPLQFNLSEST
uniref:Uncharacterized protein n=1 Tax=Kalanchoe fedtschenkoi TaxID=63787 RepID=A0A7N0UX53_KALFE